MSKYKYNFDYDSYEADCAFEVDTTIFTEEHAKATLNFFTWDYDDLENPIDEVLKKYALEAIMLSTKYSFNVRGVISDFDNKEGFCKVDGSIGIKLLYVSGYEFSEENLECEKIEI